MSMYNKGREAYLYIENKIRNATVAMEPRQDPQNKYKRRNFGFSGNGYSIEDIRILNEETIPVLPKQLTAVK